MQKLIIEAQEYMSQSNVDGWLLYDYRQSNPFFRSVLGSTNMVTRPAFLFIPAMGDAILLAHDVDLGRFSHIDHKKIKYTSRDSLIDILRQLLKNVQRVAMEYSPMGELPRVSQVDGGTLDMIRSVEVEVVSSANLVQYVTQRWNSSQLKSHKMTANLLSTIVMESFQYMKRNLDNNPSELDIVDFILKRFNEEELETPDGPIVAVDQHSSDPHYLPTEETSVQIKHGSWVLIDMWAREKNADGIFADITWVGYVGDVVPSHYQEIFDIVVHARNIALDFLVKSYRTMTPPQGWQVDKIARDYISSKGYGHYFTHRLGHSLSTEVHGDAVNLDGWETHDTRLVIPQIGITIEPGIYMPEFGMRSEIDVYISDSGPLVTSDIQNEIVLVV